MSYNVNRGVTDNFYRYKMPRLVAKVEGKGNGIKTVIVNMVDIAKALGRPPTYPCKYFGCELGAQTQFDFKNDRYIVNGSHDPTKLQGLLDGFIRRFVLCPECDNPETVLVPYEKKGIIKQNCKACGHQNHLDMRHKLTTFILKNPPDVKPNQQGTSLTKKKDRKKDEKNGVKGTLHPDSPKMEKSDPSDNDINGESEADDDWGDDLSTDAQNERMQELSSGLKSLTMNSDLEKPLSERLEIFFSYCKKKAADGVTTSVFKDIKGEADRLEVRENKGVMVLVEVLLGENIIEQLKQYRLLFLIFTQNSAKVQKYMLGAVEKLVECKRDALMNKVPLILKTIYDNDIIDEEVLLEWGKKPLKKYVSKEIEAEIHAKAGPFLKWLQEAEEEESSEDEEEGSDVEITYSNKVCATTLKEQEAKSKPSAPTVAAPPPGAATEDDGHDDDSDVDIDNM